MVTKVSSKGRITIPKKIRDRLGLKPGMVVEVFLNKDGQIVISSAETKVEANQARFDMARGKADIRFKTEDLMMLLRGEN